MKLLIVVAILGLSQIGAAQTDESILGLGGSSDHVQVLRKPETKKVVKKSSKRSKSKKLSKNHQKKPALAKTNVASKKPIVAAVPVRPSQVPGKRVALANPNSARANMYSSSSANEAISLTSPESTTAPSLKAQIKQPENEEKINPVGFKLKSYNAMDYNSIVNYGAERDYTVRAWERVYLFYNINKDIHAGLFGQYWHTWFQDQDRLQQGGNNPGLHQSYASYLGDSGVYIEDKNLATFGDGFKLAGEQYYLAPTSEAAQTAGELGETRTHLDLSKSFGKFDLKWIEEFRYYIQQYETNSWLNAKGQPIDNVAFRLLNLMDIGYNFTSKLNFTLETGVVNEGTYGDSFNGGQMTYIDYFIFNPDLGYEFNKYFALDLGIWEAYNYTNPPTQGGTPGAPTAYYTPLAPYNGTASGSWAETSIYLQGTVKF